VRLRRRALKAREDLRWTRGSAMLSMSSRSAFIREQLAQHAFAHALGSRILARTLHA
jgi:hypothetical protein